MREDILREIELHYSEQQIANERIELSRKNDIRLNYPDIQHLIEEREYLIHGAIRGILNGKQNMTNIPEQMDALNKKIHDSLLSNGLPADYLEPVRKCPICNDTGYVGYPIKQPCECFQKEYQKKIRGEIGLYSEKESFETFNPDLIPDEIIPGKNITQRHFSIIARDQCEEWANSFPNNKFQNVLLSGKSGLGKTFLLHAIAKRLIERDVYVISISAYQFLQTARKSYFEQDNSLDDIMNVSVLLIDDLGSEPLMKNITVEVLFNLLNERLIRGKATIISTNLTLQELRERYTERIVSRISDPTNTLILPLEGKDLRKINR